LESTWLINPQNARLAVILVNIWKSTPFVALLLLAGMQGISQDQYEAGAYTTTVYIRNGECGSN